MTRKIDVSLAHHRKLCSKKKNQVAQLKLAQLKRSHDNDKTDQARNDLKD